MGLDDGGQLGDGGCDGRVVVGGVEQLAEFGDGILGGYVAGGVGGGRGGGGGGFLVVQELGYVEAREGFDFVPVAFSALDFRGDCARGV